MIPAPGPTASAYLSAWDHRDYRAMAALVRRPPADFAALHAAVISDLGVTTARYRAGVVTQRGPSAIVPVATVLTLGVGVHLTLHSTLHLILVQGRWMVDWTSRTIAASFGKMPTTSVRRLISD